MGTDEPGERVVLFSEAELRQDPATAVEELRSADFGVVVDSGGLVVVADSETLARTVQESYTELSDGLRELYNQQPGSYQIDLGNGLLVDAMSGQSVQLSISGIQLPGPDPTPSKTKRYRCTNGAERHVVHLVGGVVGGACPRQLRAGGACPGVLEAY